MVLILLSQFLILENVNAYEYKPISMVYHSINNTSNPSIIKSYNYRHVTGGDYGSCSNYSWLSDYDTNGVSFPVDSNNYQMYEIPNINLVKGHRYKIIVMYARKLEFLGGRIGNYNLGIDPNMSFITYNATTDCVPSEPAVEFEFLQTTDVKNDKLYLFANKSNTAIMSLDKLLIEDLGVDSDYTCRDSINLLNVRNDSFIINGITYTKNEDGSFTLNGTASKNVTFNLNTNITFDTGTYTVSINNIVDNMYLSFDNISSTMLSSVYKTKTWSISNETTYNRYFIWIGANTTFNNDTFYIQVEKGSSATSYEEYGKQICVNKQDETNNKLDEAEKTRKGILGKIGDLFTAIVELPGKLVNMLIDAIKGLFVPDTEEMNSIIDDFKEVMAEKLGAIYQVVDYLTQIFANITGSNINSNSCMIFPSMTDPIFNIKLWDEQNFCFDTFRSNFKTLFIISDSIICIICTCMVINMLHKKLEGFFGGVNSDY